MGKTEERKRLLKELAALDEEKEEKKEEAKELEEESEEAADEGRPAEARELKKEATSVAADAASVQALIELLTLSLRKQGVSEEEIKAAKTRKKLKF